MRKSSQQLDRVVFQLFPKLTIQPTKQICGIVVPNPPEISGQLKQRLELDGDFGGDLNRSERGNLHGVDNSVEKVASGQWSLAGKFKLSLCLLATNQFLDTGYGSLATSHFAVCNVQLRSYRLIGRDDFKWHGAGLMRQFFRSLEALEVRRLLAAGQLDPLFGVRGEQTIQDGSIYRENVQVVGQGPNGSTLFRLVRRVDDDSGVHDQPLLRMIDSAGESQTSFSFDGELALDTFSDQIAIDSITGMIAVFDGLNDNQQFVPRVRFFSATGVELSSVQFNAIALDEGDTLSHAISWDNGRLYVAVGRFDLTGESNQIAFYRVQSNLSIDETFAQGSVQFTPDFFTVRVSQIVPLRDGDVVLVLSNYADFGPILPGYQAIRFDHDGSRAQAGDILYTTIDLTDQISARFRPSELDGVAALVQVQGDGYFNERVDLYDSTGALIRTIAPNFLGGTDRTEDATDFHVNQNAFITLALRRLIDGQRQIIRLDSSGSTDERFGLFGSTSLDPSSQTRLFDDGSSIVFKLQLPKSGGFRRVELQRYQGGPGRTDTPGTIEVEGKAVIFHGTGQSDLIRLMIRGSDGRLVARINSLIRSFDPRKAKRLTILCFNGDDEVIIGDSVLGTRVEGGRGNDTIVGGTGDDQIFGGPHDDLLLGSRGNDQLRGEGGNDSINGGRGRDTLWGELGHDTLNGAGHGDILLGGQKMSDLILGGTGFDSATQDPLDEYRDVESFRLA